MGNCMSYAAAWFLPPGMLYEEAKLRMCTFDLVYFCQLNTLTGPFVAMFAGKMITHMGICVRDAETNELFVLESVRHADTSCDVADHNRVHTGVRLVSLYEILRHRSENCFVCFQPIIMTESVRNAAEAKLPAFIKKHIKIPFEDSPTCFARAQLNRGWWGYASEDTRTLFCSELAALTLRSCGLLPHVENVSAVWHTMFWCCQLALVTGARISEHKHYIRMLPSSLAALRPPPAPRIGKKRPPPAAAAAVIVADETHDQFIARLHAMADPLKPP